MLLSSHLLPDVEAVCERVVVLYKGRVVRDGAIRDLTAVRDGLYEIRVRDHKSEFVEALGRLGCSCREESDGSLIILKPGDLEPRVFFEVAQGQHTQIRHIHAIRQRLEEVFMEAIGHETAGVSGRK